MLPNLPSKNPPGSLPDNGHGPESLSVSFAAGKDSWASPALTATRFSNVMATLARLMDGEPFDETVIPD